MIIVLFHVLYLLGKIVYRSYTFGRQRRAALEIEVNESGNESNVKEIEDSETKMENQKVIADKNEYNLKRRRINSSCASDEESKSPVIRFSPPVYIQRYQIVQNVLTHERYGGRLRKVVDFGCSELGFCTYLKHTTGVEEAIFVDIDRETLETYKERATPLYADYLHRRTSPLKFSVYEGSVTHNDKILQNCDAVIMIELIEHLWPETLVDVPDNIFGFIKPQVAVVTTPNAEFNVLFTNFSGMRHPDHKFEWTRQQFQDWANNIVARYPDYEVYFYGIGHGPPGTEKYGACSQMAVFHRLRRSNDDRPGVEGLLKEVVIEEYPYTIDNRSDEEKILDDAVFHIRRFGRDETMEEEVPLKLVSDCLKKFYITIDTLREVLVNSGWAVADREAGPVVIIPPPTVEFSDGSSSKEEDYLDEHPPRYVEWDEPEPGPGDDYFDRCNQKENNDDRVDPSLENWDTDSSRTPDSNDHCHDQTIVDNETSNCENLDATMTDNSSISFNPDNIRSEELDVTNFSDQANRSSTLSITISSFPDTSGSDTTNISNVEIPEMIRDDASSTYDVIALSPYKKPTNNHRNSKPDCNSSFSKKKSRIENSENDIRFLPRNNATEFDSMCSIYLEPSSISQGDLDLSMDCMLAEKSSDERTIDTTMAENKSSDNDCSFSLSSISNSTFTDEPRFTSSPEKKRTNNKSKLVGSSTSISDCVGNDETSHNLSETSIQSDTSASSGSSFIRKWYPEESHPLYKTEHALLKGGCEDFVRPLEKVSSENCASIEVSSACNAETKLSPEALESPLNSWTPEILDSGYPNSASGPDMTPEYDLSSIAHDQISEPESPSVEDVPRVGFPVGVENGDLANNNRDGEGNNMEAIEERVLNDLQPLIDRLENDLENENDIYDGQNGFPIWLLRILQRLDIPQNHPDEGLQNIEAGDVNVEREVDEGFDSSANGNHNYSDAEEERSITEDPSITQEHSEVANRENLGDTSDVENDQLVSNSSIIAQCNDSHLRMNFSTDSSVESTNENLRNIPETLSVDKVTIPSQDMPEDVTDSDIVAASSSSMKLGGNH